MPVSPEKRAELIVRMQTLGIREADLEEHFTRGSGRGGQKVNKTNNCVFLRHIPTGIVIKCHRERERETNRFLARRALCDELDHRLNGACSTREAEIRRARKRKDTRRRKHIRITQRKHRRHNVPYCLSVSRNPQGED